MTMSIAENILKTAYDAIGYSWITAIGLAQRQAVKTESSGMSLGKYWFQDGSGIEFLDSKHYGIVTMELL